MTKPRAHQISLEATPYYHCISRCVRQAYLCGINYATAKNHENRRKWLENTILELGEIFMIKVVSYAIMSNHYHVILAVNAKGAEKLPPSQVVERWHKLFNGTRLTQDFIDGKEIPAASQRLLSETIEKWRERLTSISWFMRYINENLARIANEEDKCKGRFWEGRFKSQALIGEQALLACMAYVDLNPIRAKMAKSLESSSHTSIKRHLDLAKGKKIINPEATLIPFSDQTSASHSFALSFTMSEYLETVKWSSRQVHSKNNGKIIGKIPSKIESMKFSNQHWLYLIQNFESELKLS